MITTGFFKRGMVASALAMALGLASFDTASAQELSPKGFQGDEAAVKQLLRKNRKAPAQLKSAVMEKRVLDAAALGQEAPPLSDFGGTTRGADGAIQEVAPSPDLIQQSARIASQPRKIAAPATSNRVVVGTDDRVQINATASYPFRVFGFLMTDYANFTGGCSATLISPQHLLTAAHCVYNAEQGGWPQKVTFFPGRNGNDTPFGGYEAETWSVPSAYTKAGPGYTLSHVYSDIAVVKLRERLGDTLGYLAINSAQSLVFDNNIVGYPGDKPFASMWRASCNVDMGRDQIFYHDCDTWQGMSGGANYDYDKAANTRTIYGVNVAGSDSLGKNISFGLTSFSYCWVLTYAGYKC